MGTSGVAGLSGAIGETASAVSTAIDECSAILDYVDSQILLPINRCMAEGLATLEDCDDAIKYQIRSAILNAEGVLSRKDAKCAESVRVKLANAYAAAINTGYIIPSAGELGIRGQSGTGSTDPGAPEPIATPPNPPPSLISPATVPVVRPPGMSLPATYPTTQLPTPHTQALPPTGYFGSAKEDCDPCTEFLGLFINGFIDKPYIGEVQPLFDYAAVPLNYHIVTDKCSGHAWAVPNILGVDQVPLYGTKPVVECQVQPPIPPPPKPLPIPEEIPQPIPPPGVCCPQVSVYPTIDVHPTIVPPANVVVNVQPFSGVIENITVDLKSPIVGIKVQPDLGGQWGMANALFNPDGVDEEGRIGTFFGSWMVDALNANLIEDLMKEVLSPVLVRPASRYNEIDLVDWGREP